MYTRNGHLPRKPTNVSSMQTYCDAAIHGNVQSVRNLCFFHVTDINNDTIGSFAFGNIETVVEVYRISVGGHKI